MAEDTHETKIRITGDESSAVRSISAVVGGLNRVRAAVSNVMRALGVIGFAVHGVEMIVDVFRKVRDKITETERALAKVRWDSWVGGFNAAADVLIDKHAKIAALMKEELQLASRANALDDLKVTQDRGFEDASRDLDRRLKLAGAGTPQERQDLQDRFAAEDAAIAARRAEEDRKRRIARLDEEDSIYQSKANGAQDKIGEIDAEIKKQEELLRIRRLAKDEGAKETEQRIAALKKEREAMEELLKQASEEAKFRRDQIAILERAGSVAEAISGQRKAVEQAEADGKEQAAGKEDARKNEAHAEKMSSSAAEDDWQRRYRTSDERGRQAMLEERENAAKDRLEEAEKALAEEMAKDAKDRDRERMDRARAAAESAQADMFAARRRREELEETARREQQSRIDTYYGSMAESASRVRGDRLTEMGLGSGASRTADEQAANVKILVQLAREQLQATRDNKPGSATYAP